VHIINRERNFRCTALLLRTPISLPLRTTRRRHRPQDKYGELATAGVSQLAFEYLIAFGKTTPKQEAQLMLTNPRDGSVGLCSK